MTTEDQPATEYLAREDLDSFREDIQELERDVQSFFRVYYISGLIAVAAWVAGQQSKTFIEVALGNGGYNIYALLGVAVLNMVSLTFLMYKSISIHEIAQLVVMLSKPASAFDYWESWRRSRRHSVTKPVRFLYAPLLFLVPFGLSLVIIVVTGRMLFGDPFELVEQTRKMQFPITSPARAKSPEEFAHHAEAERIAFSERQDYAKRVLPVFKEAQIVFFVIVLLHAIPLVLAIVNSRVTAKRWESIRQQRNWDELVSKLAFIDQSVPPTAREGNVSPKSEPPQEQS